MTAGSAAPRRLAARHAPPGVSVRLVAALAVLEAWSSLVLAQSASSWLADSLEPEAVIPFSLAVLALAVGIGMGRPDTAAAEGPHQRGLSWAQ